MTPEGKGQDRVSRWALLVELRVINQPGTLARLARAFADRGINLGDILAVVGSDLLLISKESPPGIVLTFRCSARMKEFMRRRIVRMPEVVGVRELERDPGDRRAVWELLETLRKSTVR